MLALDMSALTHKMKACVGLTLEVGGDKVDDPITCSLDGGLTNNAFGVLGSESTIVARSQLLPVYREEGLGRHVLHRVSPFYRQFEMTL
jgi:hypothetical protein